ERDSGRSTAEIELPHVGEKRMFIGVRNPRIDPGCKPFLILKARCRGREPLVEIADDAARGTAPGDEDLVFLRARIFTGTVPAAAYLKAERVEQNDLSCKVGIMPCSGIVVPQDAVFAASPCFAAALAHFLDAALSVIQCIEIVAEGS